MAKLPDQLEAEVVDLLEDLNIPQRKYGVDIETLVRVGERASLEEYVVRAYTLLNSIQAWSMQE